MTVLMYALTHDRDKFVPAILKLKPDVTIALADGRQALHLAAEAGRDSQIAALIKAGASPLAVDSVSLLLTKAFLLTLLASDSLCRRCKSEKICRFTLEKQNSDQFP
jgi:ankyrin repeat protein